MSHRVKCLYCGQQFDRDWEPFVKVTTQRYAHKECAENRGKEIPIPIPVPVKQEFSEEEINSFCDKITNNITEDVEKIAKNIISESIGENSEKMILDKVFPIIEKKIHEKFGFLPEIHKIVTETKVTEIEGVMHEKFDKVLQMVALDIPVYLTGKAGTGKNVICKQVAESLGLEFYFTNAVTQEYKLTGFIDANGAYQETQFYKAFSQGGLFFLDEMDASIPEVLIILNAAIANRYFDFPIGKIEAHKDFRVIAAGNTIGTGADSNYTGRYCLDRASLDRFAMLEIDYSPKIENSIAAHNQELIEFCHDFRKATDKAGVECLFSYRTLTRIVQLEQVFNNTEEILKISLLKGLDVDDINIILNNMTTKNKYFNALLNLGGAK